jgi:hypothetical protein
VKDPLPFLCRHRREEDGVVSSEWGRGRCCLLRVVVGGRMLVAVQAVGRRGRDGEHRRHPLLRLRGLSWALLVVVVEGWRRRMVEGRIDLYSVSILRHI